MLIAWPGHPLEAHLKGTLRVYRKLFEKHITQAVAHRLKHQGDEASLSEAKEAIAAAVALHDIGKAMKHYQTRAHKPSFYLHELYSAHTYSKLAKLLDISPLLSDICTLAVVLHHHSMRSLGTLAIESKRITGGSYHPEAHSIAAEALKEAEVKPPPELEDIMANPVHQADIRELIAKLTREARTKPGKMKLATLVTGPLSISDVIDASQNRRGWPTAFTKHIQKVYQGGYRGLSANTPSPQSHSPTPI